MNSRDLFPALAVWQDLVRRPGTGPRAGALWRAACWEATAMEQVAAGNVPASVAAWTRARELEAEEFAGLLDLPLDEDRGQPR